jgi:hypothetical protein
MPQPAPKRGFSFFGGSGKATGKTGGKVEAEPLVVASLKASASTAGAATKTTETTDLNPKTTVPAVTAPTTNARQAGAKKKAGRADPPEPEGGKLGDPLWTRKGIIKPVAGGGNNLSPGYVYFAYELADVPEMPASMIFQSEPGDDKPKAPLRIYMSRTAKAPTRDRCDETASGRPVSTISISNPTAGMYYLGVSCPDYRVFNAQVQLSTDAVKAISGGQVIFEEALDRGQESRVYVGAKTTTD